MIVPQQLQIRTQDGANIAKFCVGSTTKQEIQQRTHAREHEQVGAMRLCFFGQKRKERVAEAVMAPQKERSK